MTTWTPAPAAPTVPASWMPVAALPEPVHTRGWIILSMLAAAQHIDATTYADLLAVRLLAAHLAMSPAGAVGLATTGQLHTEQETIAAGLAGLAAELHLAASRPVTVGSSAVLRVIGELATTRTITGNRSATITRVRDMAAALTEHLAAAPALARIAGLAATQGITATGTAGLRSTGMLATSRAQTVNRAATITRIRTLNAALGITPATTCQMGFPPNAPTVQTYTSGGYTHTFPRWCNYLDVMVLGGGGGGANGNQANQEGYGAQAGQFAWITLQRGLDIPWSATTITGTVGAGGGSQTNGTPSTATIAGVGTVTGAGGAGTSDRGVFLGSARNGRPVSTGNSNSGRDLVLNGYTFAGGGESTGDTANAPGAGGRGGGGTTWPLQPGSGRPGARGEIRIRAYQ